MSVVSVAEEKGLEALTALEDVVVAAAKSVVERLEPVVKLMPSWPAAVPPPAEIVDRVYALPDSLLTYSGKLLEHQKTFAVRLADVNGLKASPKPAKSSGVKSAA